MSAIVHQSTRACVFLCVFHKYWKTLDNIFFSCVSYTLVTRFYIVSNWTTRIICGEILRFNPRERLFMQMLRASLWTFHTSAFSWRFWVHLWIFFGCNLSWTLISSVCSHNTTWIWLCSSPDPLAIRCWSRQGCFCAFYQFNVLIHDRICCHLSVFLLAVERNRLWVFAKRLYRTTLEFFFFTSFIKFC